MIRTRVPLRGFAQLLLAGSIGWGCEQGAPVVPPTPAPPAVAPQPVASQPVAPTPAPSTTARRVDTNLPADQLAPLMADIMIKGDPGEVAGLVKTIKAGNDRVFEALARAAEMVCPQGAGEAVACRPSAPVLTDLRKALLKPIAGHYQHIERPGPEGLRRTNATRAFIRLGGKLPASWPTRYEMEVDGYAEQVAFQLEHGIDVTVRQHLDANLEVPNRRGMWNIARGVHPQFQGHEEGFAAKDLSKGWRNKPFELKEGITRVLEFAAAKPEYIYGLRAIRFPRDKGAQLFVQIETASPKEARRFVSWEASPTGEGFRTVDLDGSTNVHQLLAGAYQSWKKKPRGIEEYHFLLKLR